MATPGRARSKWKRVPRNTPAELAKARRRRRQTAAQALEQHPLRLVAGMIRLIGRGQMAHDKREVDPCQPLWMGRQHLDVARSKAQPVDAGIDMKRRLATRCGPPPFGDLLKARQHRAQTVIDIKAGKARHQPVEHVDDRLALVLAQLAAFGGRSDEEGMAAGFGKRRRAAFESQPVGIALDASGAFGGGCLVAQLPPVGLERPQIHAQHCRRRPHVWRAVIAHQS